MYSLTSSMKGTTCRRFANIVFKKTDVKVCRYSSHALNMNLSDDDLNKIRDTTPNLPFQASSIFSVNSRRNLNPPTRNMSTTAVAAFVGDNTSATTPTALQVADSGGARIGEEKREIVLETNVSVKINLDGSGIADSDSGIPYLDEMLHEFASHGLFDVHVKATGDIDYDERHTNEEVAMAIGTALQQAIGDDDRKKTINRYGNFIAPHEDALIQVTLDLSGGDPRLYFYYTKPQSNTQCVKDFFKSLVDTSGMTLHVQKLSGSDEENIIEATFKAFAGALRQAIEYDPRLRPRGDGGTLPSSKGVLSQ